MYMYKVSVAYDLRKKYNYFANKKWRMWKLVLVEWKNKLLTTFFIYHEIYTMIAAVFIENKQTIRVEWYYCYNHAQIQLFYVTNDW